MAIKPAIGWSLLSASIFTFVLSAVPASGQQELNEAQALSKRVVELYKAGKYAEALPLVQKALEIREKVLGWTTLAWPVP